MDGFLESFFVTFLQYLGVYQNKILFHGPVCQCLILIQQFCFRINQFKSLKRKPLISKRCYFSCCKQMVSLNLHLRQIQQEDHWLLLVLMEVRLYCHPRYKRKELLYVFHCRCKVGQSSSNQSTFLSTNRIPDCPGIWLLLVCPPKKTDCQYL